MESFKPIDPWAEMARSNYCGDETVYLGVRLNKRLSPLKDWEKVILKMKKVESSNQKKGGGNFHSRVRMVNTYLTPCMGYLVRFKLIPKSVASLMWKSIRSVVFGQTTQVAYSNMSQVIPIEIKDLYVGEGRAECVVYNLAHAIRPQLKRNLIKFLIRGLPTRDKLAHFTNQNSSCRLCHHEKGVTISSSGGMFCG